MKTYPAILIALVITLLAISSATASTPDRYDAVDDYMEQFIKDYRIPGVAVAVIEGDQIVYARGFGSADPSGRPITAQTPFIIGSTTKSLTALAMMQLVEAGKVELDSPVQTYLPWFTLGDGKITVRHLLHHTSGISTDLGQDALISNDSDADALERQVRKTIGAELVHEPGTTYEYANMNYETAGLIIQEVSGLPFESYLQQHIFEPLELQCSYTSKTDARQYGLAQGYHYWFGLPVSAGNTPFPRQKVPSGFLAMCVEDMARALILHLNDGIYQGYPLVSSKGVELLHTPGPGNYAMGWIQHPNDILEHGGSVPDYGSGIILDPSQNLGVIVFYNINNVIGASPLRIMHWNILNILTGSTLAPPPSNQLYLIFLAVFLFLLLVAVAWTFISNNWIRRWKIQPEQYPGGRRLIFTLAVPLVLELGIITAIFYLITSMSYGFKNLMLHQPDLASLFLAIALLVILNAGIRTIRAVRLRAQKASDRSTGLQHQ